MENGHVSGNCYVWWEDGVRITLPLKDGKPPTAEELFEFHRFGVDAARMIHAGLPLGTPVADQAQDEDAQGAPANVVSLSSARVKAAVEKARREIAAIRAGDVETVDLADGRTIEIARRDHPLTDEERAELVEWHREFDHHPEQRD